MANLQNRTAVCGDVDELSPLLEINRQRFLNQRIDAVQDNMLQLGNYEVPVGKSYAEEFMKQLRGL